MPIRDPMIQCNVCSTPNEGLRRFCRECGSLMVCCCRQCGFANMPADKYCGGCGMSLTDMVPDSPQSQERTCSAPAPGKYSHDDISELFGRQAQDMGPAKRKKEPRATDSVSQDMLDSIFDATDSD
jgi:hypothetical protein